MRKLNLIIGILLLLVPSLLFSATVRYFAEVKNNVVQRVIVANEKGWCEKNLGGVWEETFMDTNLGNYAGKGYTYISAKNNFSAPKPYTSWTLDAKCQWQPPVARPVGKITAWNENIKAWVELNVAPSNTIPATSAVIK